MSLETRIVALAQAMGTDVKALHVSQGSLSTLNTTTKTSLVAAINELLTLISSAGVAIDDGAGNGSTLCRLAARSRSCCTDRHTSRKRCIGGRKR